VFRANIEDEIALMYIKDTARAIALLHTTEKLRYNVYNIGADRFVPNRELIDTIREIVPGFKVELPLGHSPFPPTPILDTKRLKEDTGFTIKFDIPSAIEDYVNWLNAGNSK
jgi:UDP-glucose 4-epimerase